jgi:hypothetical protein
VRLVSLMSIISRASPAHGRVRSADDIAYPQAPTVGGDHR